MSLVIYEMAHSPYRIPITQALRAFGAPFEHVAVLNWDRSEIIRLTNGAYYQVPMLVDDDRVIFESSDTSLDVAQYIDQRFGQGRLFPERFEGVQGVVVEHIENELECLTFELCDIHYIPAIEDLVERTMVIRHKERRFGRGCVNAWRADAAALKQETETLLGKFDATLKHSQFLFSDEAPIYADFALLGVVGNYTHGGHHQLSPNHTALLSWHQRLLDYRFTPSAS